VGTVTIGVSIAVPEPHGSLLQERRAGFGDPAACCIPTHVTLLPPTEVEDSALPAIEAHLMDVAAAGRPFPMRLSGTGTFRPLSPVVYVRVAEGAEACTWLQKQVRDTSGPVARELQFPYHPHVTVAHHLPDAKLDRAFDDLASFECSFTVDRFSLYVHDKQNGWAPTRHFALTAAADG
jgi:2'-5' RNA ligase